MIFPIIDENIKKWKLLNTGNEPIYFIGEHKIFELKPGKEFVIEHKTNNGLLFFNFNFEYLDQCKIEEKHNE